MSKPRSLYVKLISEEGTEFILSRAAAYQSRILRGLFETMDSSNNMDNFETNLDESDFRVEMPVLPLEEIGAKVLDLVCQYLSERYVSSCHMSDFSQLKCLDPSNDEDRQLVLDLLLAADYLDC
eukprot:Tbor_TRINITY_DN4519_c0_g1::TRINITY_DN4519_c0_g1_i1::g.15843::m.15843/K03872/TCEB1; transcription elongation factor B, polypeptide 1